MPSDILYGLLITSISYLNLSPCYCVFYTFQRTLLAYTDIVLPVIGERKWSLQRTVDRIRIFSEHRIQKGVAGDEGAEMGQSVAAVAECWKRNRSQNICSFVASRWLLKPVRKQFINITITSQNSDCYSHMFDSHRLSLRAEFHGTWHSDVVKRDVWATLCSRCHKSFAVYIFLFCIFFFYKRHLNRKK